MRTRKHAINQSCSWKERSCYNNRLPLRYCVLVSTVCITQVINQASSLEINPQSRTDSALILSTSFPENSSSVWLHSCSCLLSVRYEGTQTFFTTELQAGEYLKQLQTLIWYLSTLCIFICIFFYSAHIIYSQCVSLSFHKHEGYEPVKVSHQPKIWACDNWKKEIWAGQ